MSRLASLRHQIILPSYRGINKTTISFQKKTLCTSRSIIFEVFKNFGDESYYFSHPEE